MLGAYISNDKSKSYILRELCPTKPKPSFSKVVEVSSPKTIPTEVIKIPIHKKAEDCGQEP